MDFLKPLAPQAHWLSRLALAAIFAYHAFPKLVTSGAVAEMMGMPALVVLILGVAELAGAALILWGGVGPDWATRTAGLIFAVVMVGAIAMVHASQGWNSVGAMGMEFQVLIFAVSVYFASKGNDAN
jgi:uncharacterized membrane protein YphA (DoxX/SURF4 family)